MRSIRTVINLYEYDDAELCALWLTQQQGVMRVSDIL